MLEELDEADVYITPPGDGQLSEEDTDDTEYQLSGQQLNAEANARFITTYRETVNPADECNLQATSDEEQSI